GWGEGIVRRAYTNLYDAIETAFQYAGKGREPSADPVRVDAVFVLSDGFPNRGRYFERKQLIAGVAALSEKQVPVHTIGTGNAAGFPLLRESAGATGGGTVAAPAC